MSEKKKLGKKAKAVLITLGIIALLALCVVCVSFYAKTGVAEGNQDIPRTDYIDYETADKALEALGTSLKEANDDSACAVSVYTDINVDDASVAAADLNEADLTVIKYSKNAYTGAVSEAYPSNDGHFATGYKAVPAAGFTAVDIENFTYDIALNDDGSEKDYADFSFELSEAYAKKNAPEFSFECDKEALKLLKEKLGGKVDISDAKAETVSACVNGSFDRDGGRAKNAVFTRTRHIDAKVKFLGDYSALGASDISFDYTVTVHYDFKWAGINFTESTLWLKPGEEAVLPLNAVIDSEHSSENYELEFASSDKSVVEVKGSGDIKGLKLSTSPVKVTAEFKYLGRTYTDEIEVYCVTQVEKVFTDPRELSLTVGQTKTLGSVVSPEDAGVKDVVWFSEDENIACVDRESGLVTAKSEGTVKVYCITINGNFRASCTVTVTKGGASNG